MGDKQYNSIKRSEYKKYTLQVLMRRITLVPVASIGSITSERDPSGNLSGILCQKKHTTNFSSMQTRVAIHY
jgi:hypothetical protein